MPLARYKFYLLLVVAVVFSGCSLIDEDLSKCGVECNIDYELQLITNMTTELQTQLSMETEVSVAAALRAFLADVFTDYAHDVSLSFYDVQGDSTRLHYENHIMDASQSSYTLHIPLRSYMHLAVANLEENSEVSIINDETCHGARLEVALRDTIDSHNTGVFTARLPMEMREGIDQQFNVSLYMAGAASALVLDTLGSHIKDIKVYASGFADGFNLADSTYTFDRNPIVRTKEVIIEDEEAHGADPMCFASVTFPSKDIPQPETKTVIETLDPFVSVNAETALWQLDVYATLPDGKITRTVLGIHLPLRPGQAKIIRARMYDDGSAHSFLPYVGASVTLDWAEGSSHDITL